MPESDVYHEGNLWASKEEFIKFLGRPDKVVTVIRFKFTPIEPITVRLTPKEKEVYDLVVAGVENKDIASKLEISVRTVETHVSSILSKSGFKTRYQVAANLYPDFVEVSKFTPSQHAFSNYG
jgi:DNA-binding CsgD family transcriptional regulator